MIALVVDEVLAWLALLAFLGAGCALTAACIHVVTGRPWWHAFMRLLARGGLTW